MRVRVYPDGCGDDCEDYEDGPSDAVLLFAEENDGVVGDVIVEALDDEAKALPGWHSDEESSHFKMFKVRTETTYLVTEVQTFRT